MIDTIKLVLDKSMFWLKDLSLFQKERQNACRGYFTLVQNPTKAELKKGIYKPKLTLTQRFNCSGRLEPTLSIELSLPKLLFGNNFEELTIDNYDEVKKLLKFRLKDMGIGIFEKLLDIAPVSSVHYSKNILLTDGSTPSYYINQIKQSNISFALDVNQTDFRNDGYSFKWHSNSYEISFYDKLKDLETAKKSEKRSIEKDNAIQLQLFDTIKKRGCFEVLRMEVRLNKRQKINQLFNKLNITNSLTFKQIFNSETSKQVLLYYLNEIENQRTSLFSYQKHKNENLLSDLVIHNPSLKSAKVLQLYGAKKAVDEKGIRGLRNILGKYSQRSWYRLITEVKNVKLPIVQSPFRVIRDCINTFKPLKQVDFKDIMLNNVN